MYKHKLKLHLPNIKLKFTSAALALFLLSSLTLWFSHSVQAVGDASFILSPNSGGYTVGKSFTVNVYETSQTSDGVEGVQANLSYNATDLQCNSVSESGTPFTYLGQSTCGSGSIQVGEASASVVSGQQLVATITFTTLVASSPSLSIVSGSDIQNSASTSVWNGVDTAASFTVTNPPVTTTTTSSTPPATTPTKTTTSSTGSKKASSTARSTPSTTTTPTATTTTTPSTTSGTVNEPATTQTPQNSSGSVAVPGVATLTIVVTDTHGKPIANAKVVVDNQYREITNANGKAGFSNLNDGTYTVTITAPGKKPYTNKIVLSGSNSKTVAAKLTSSSPIKTVVYVVLGFVVLGGIELVFMRYTSQKRKKAQYVTTDGDMVVGLNSGGSKMTGNEFKVQTLVGNPASETPTEVVDPTPATPDVVSDEPAPETPTITPQQPSENDENPPSEDKN